MRAVKGATIMFGLANVPVDVCTAFREQKVKLKTLHADCGTPVKKVYVCRVCGEEVAETIKGFEYAKGQMVFIEPEELERFAIPRSAVIDVRKFVPLSDIPPSWIVKSHWLQPNSVLTRQYETIVRALEKKRVAGVGVSALWGKESPVAIVATDGAMMMHELHCYDEIVSPTDILGMLDGEVRPEEMALAESLIDVMTGALDEGDLRSRSRERETMFINAKAAQEPVQFPDEPEPAVPSFDFFSELARSVEDAKQRAAV